MALLPALVKTDAVLAAIIAALYDGSIKIRPDVSLMIVLILFQPKEPLPTGGPVGGANVAPVAKLNRCVSVADCCSIGIADRTVVEMRFVEM